MAITINSGAYTADGGYSIVATLEDGTQQTFQFATHPDDMPAAVEAEINPEEYEVELPDGTII